MATKRQRALLRAGWATASVVALHLSSGYAGATVRSNDKQAVPTVPTQQTVDSPQNVPDIRLSPSQKQIIAESVRNQHPQKSTEPVGFRAAVGAQVPSIIKLEPLPTTVIEFAQQLKDYSYAFVANQILIVDPKTNTVVAVIAD
jgi:hypothetical protein